MTQASPTASAQPLALPKLSEGLQGFVADWSSDHGWS